MWVLAQSTPKGCSFTPLIPACLTQSPKCIGPSRRLWWSPGTAPGEHWLTTGLRCPTQDRWWKGWGRGGVERRSSPGFSLQRQLSTWGLSDEKEPWVQIQKAGKEGLGLGTWGNRRPAQLEGHEGSGGRVGESSKGWANSYSDMLLILPLMTTLYWVFVVGPTLY